DLINSKPSSLQRAQAAARAFVEKNVQPTDLVGVATLDLRRGYKLLANFTTDRAAAAEAIDHPGSFRSTDPLQLAGTANFDKRALDEEQALSVAETGIDRKSTRLNSSHVSISYAVFCLK